MIYVKRIKQHQPITQYNQQFLYLHLEGVSGLNVEAVEGGYFIKAVWTVWAELTCHEHETGFPPPWARS